MRQLVEALEADRPTLCTLPLALCPPELAETAVREHRIPGDLQSNTLLAGV